jgi:hypothetical protein
MMTTMTSSSSRSSAKPRNDNDNDNYNDDDDNKDVVIASVSKKNDNHNVVFLTPVTIAVMTVGEGVICPHRCPLTLTPLHRRRGRDPSSLKPWRANNKRTMTP